MEGGRSLLLHPSLKESVIIVQRRAEGRAQGVHALGLAGKAQGSYCYLRIGWRCPGRGGEGGGSFLAITQGSMVTWKPSLIE